MIGVIDISYVIGMKQVVNWRQSAQASPSSCASYDI